MVSDSFGVVDVEAWVAFGEEQLGSKPKQWLLDADGEPWLIKWPELNRDRRWGDYLRGDDWAEVLASRVARCLGLPTADVHLARRSGPFGDAGVITRSFVDESVSLVHGNELLAAADERYNDDPGRYPARYTVAAVLRCLDGIDPLDSGIEGLTAVDVFVGYLVLDAVIGNLDRHHQNWGILEGASPPRLAPTFDHGSALGSSLGDAERRARLETSDRNYSIEAWSHRARTPFAGQLHPIEVVAVACQLVGPAARDLWTSRLREHQEAIAAVFDEAPTERVSALALRFGAALVTANLETLQHRLGSLPA